MCSIEEAWAGQTFENKPVQSQSDIHRKYMTIPTNLLQRNDEFSIGHKDPTPRNCGPVSSMNSRIPREPRVPSHMVSTDLMDINLASVPNTESRYAGVSPRPEYMSIYDNADTASAGPIPMPSGSNISNFNDINQAFSVSPTMDKFMNVGGRGANETSLFNELNENDRIVYKRKFKNMENMANITQSGETPIPNSTPNAAITSSEIQRSLLDILARLDKLEQEMRQSQNGRGCNMFDMILYIMLGMLIAFIIYNVIRR
jgi:hypothetical protein